MAIIPLSQRPLDWAILVFFFFNILFVTYIIDLEQLVIADPFNFTYPIWPPPFCVDIIHWYARTFDPVLLARPVWWKVTIWWDVLFFGPFYVFAIHAFIKGKNWIYYPSIIYSSVIFTIVTIILSEEVWGAHPAANLPFVLAVNGPWLLMPLVILWRMISVGELPFSTPTQMR